MPLALISFINGAITHNHPVCCFIILNACRYSDRVLRSLSLIYARYFSCATFDFQRLVFCLLQQNYAFSTSVDMMIVTKVKLSALNTNLC
jgi:hypothetical protein